MDEKKRLIVNPVKTVRKTPFYYFFVFDGINGNEIFMEAVLYGLTSATVFSSAEQQRICLRNILPRFSESVLR